MSKVELSPIEWYQKVTEALTLALRDIRNGMHPQEHHMDVMKAVFPVYHNGELVLEKDEMQTTESILSQGMLFGNDNPSEPIGEKPDGTEVDKKG